MDYYILELKKTRPPWGVWRETPVVLLLKLPPVRPGVEVFTMHTRRGHAHAVHLVDTAMTASRCGVTPAVVIKFSKYSTVWSSTSCNFMEITFYNSLNGVLQ